MSHSSSEFAEPPFSKALPWVLLVAMMFFLNQTSRMLLAPLLVPLEREFNLSLATAGSLLLFTSAGNAFSIFCSGFLSSRLQHRYVIPLAIGCYGLALLFLSGAQSLTHLRIGFTVCGMAGGLYFPSGMAALGSLVDRRHWGKAIAVHELAPNLAFIVAPLVAEFALQHADWRTAMQGMASVALCGAAVFLAIGKGGRFHGEPPGRHTVPALLRRRDTWLFVTLIGVAVAVEWAPYSIMGLFLVNGEGMDRTQANSLMALTRLSAPVLALVGGWLTDKFGERSTLLGTFWGSVLCLAGMAVCHGTALVVLLFVQAVLPPLMFPAVFKLFAAVFAAKERSLVLSMTMPPVSLLAAGGMPALIGYCGELGSFGAGFGILALLSLLCIPVILRFCETAGQRTDAA